MHNGCGGHAQYRHFSCTTSAVSMLIRARRIQLYGRMSVQPFVKKRRNVRKNFFGGIIKKFSNKVKTPIKFGFFPFTNLRLEETKS